MAQTQVLVTLVTLVVLKTLNPKSLYTAQTQVGGAAGVVGEAVSGAAGVVGGAAADAAGAVGEAAAGAAGVVGGAAAGAAETISGWVPRANAAPVPPPGEGAVGVKEEGGADVGGEGDGESVVGATRLEVKQQRQGKSATVSGGHSAAAPTESIAKGLVCRLEYHRENAQEKCEACVREKDIRAREITKSTCVS
jgi:hypothetical protein